MLGSGFPVAVALFTLQVALADKNISAVDLVPWQSETGGRGGRKK